MKKLFWIAIALWLAVTTIWVHALWLWQDSMFLKADTAKECQNVGWTYTTLNDKNYCTNNPSTVLTKFKQTRINGVTKKILTMIQEDRKSVV